jgi:hypothetical protein
MIDEHNDIFDSKITLHDKHRFEIKLDIDLPQSSRTVYELESYFFVPRALNIGPATYTKKDFYNNNQRYIRFKTPRISLSKLCDPGLSTSPLNRVKENLSRILSGSKEHGLVERAYEEFKLLGCVIRGEIRDNVRAFMADLETYSPRPGGQGKRLFVCEGLDAFLADLRNLDGERDALKVTVMDPVIPLKLRETSKFLDEYLSLITEEYLTSLLEALRKNSAALAALKSVEEELTALIVAQSRYRAAMNYPSILKEGENNEVIIYRRGVLKKFISSALYLKSELDEWQTGTQLVLGLAAGLAMLFAALAAIYAQNRYTMNSAPFVLIVVVSYIFKDRIKDWLKLLFSRNLTRWFSDREIRILDPENSKKIGVLKEAFTFISEAAVPPDISRLRKIDNITSIDEDGKPERVFKYKKEIALYPRKILAAHNRRKDLNDIMRFNIKDFITQADDSRVDYTYADPATGRIKTASCARVYHMNLIIKYSYADAQGADKIHYDRIRIVLNKEGLVRLEEVKLI